MTITTEITEPKFEPVKITILCETQDERDAIVTLFQSELLDCAVGDVWPSMKHSDKLGVLPICRVPIALPKCSALREAIKNNL